MTPFARPAGVPALAVGILLAILSGCFAALAAPPYRAWPLIFVAFVPMILAQHRVLPVRWSFLAPAVTLGLWFASQVLEGLIEGGVPTVFRLLPLYVGLVAAALSWRTRRFHETTHYRWFILATPAAWVAIDFLRGTQALLDATWGNPVYALWAHPMLLQPVSVVGIYGLELLLLMANWSIAGLLIARRQTLRPAAGLGAAAVIWTIASLLMMSSPAPVLRVAAIQPGPTRDHADELANDIEQTRAAAAAGARLIVWREAGVPFDPRSTRTGEFASLARETRAYLVIGFHGVFDDHRNLNMAAVFSPQGEVIGSFGKDHPITFAGDFNDVRTGYPVWNTSLGRLAAIICADIDFTDTSRHMAQRGAQIVAVPSNDSVPFLTSHYTHLVFRAIENRIVMVKADHMRDAAIVDPWGRVVASTVDRRGRRSTLIADVPLGTPYTLSTRLGDWMGWLCLGLSTLFTLARRAREFLELVTRGIQA